jgi:NAD dependent epimerase/dehydratase family
VHLTLGGIVAEGRLKQSRGRNMTKSALIAGASGIVGNTLSRQLTAKGWKVFGVARRPPADIEGLTPVAADLLDPASLRRSLDGLRPEYVFLSTWLRQPTEVENIKVNSAMVRNLLDALSQRAPVQHVALVTGLKHYLGPFEAYGKGKLPATPFREEQPRLDLDNFYYAQEDGIRCSAARRLSLERAPSTHHHRIRYRQRDEHGRDAGRLRNDLPRDRTAVPLSRIGNSVEQPDRHDRCWIAC